MPALLRSSVWSLFTIACLCHIAASQEWTRFRGPNGSGISDATTVPVKWTEKDFNWTADLPGQGHSSPVVWGDKAVDRQTGNAPE